MEKTNEVLKKIKRLYGEEAIYLLNDFPTQDVDVIPTGALLLDQALGVGGIPRGRVTEIFGLYNTGKTTICQHIIAEAQRLGLTPAYIDVENVLDFQWASLCGVDFDNLLLSQPSFAETALGIAEKLIKSGEIGLVVIDSAAALTPKSEETEEEFKDVNTTGMRRAKLLYHFFRVVVPALRRNNVALVFTNQMRDNTKSIYGGVLPGCGHAIKYYASVRMELKVKKSGRVFSGDTVVGQEVQANIVKNRVAPPLKTASFVILFDAGIDKAADVLTAALSFGIVTKAGPYLRYNETTIGQGKAKTIQALRENPELLLAIEQECKEILYG